jgi:hypothetical protein
VTNHDRKRGVDHQVLAGRPGLRTASRRVLDGIHRLRPRITPNASGRRPSKNWAASRIPAAITAASSLKPYRRRPQAMNELSNGQTVPTW